MPNSDLKTLQVVLVTGPSGAGRTTAINVLEDLGFEAIDNLPLRLLPGLVDSVGASRPMALGLDGRNRDFSPTALLDVIEMLRMRRDVAVQVLYIDARTPILAKRYSETRRRHPMAPAETPPVGIEREISLLGPIREQANLVIDTSAMNIHQLKAEIERIFAPEGRRLAISIESFSYKRGVPSTVDMVFDCRFLANPYWRDDLRQRDGRDAEVQEYVCQDPRFEEFYAKVSGLLQLLLPAFRDEGKSHLSVAFGCTGGRHRSVTLAETLARALAEDDQQVSIRHRELQS